MSSVLRMPIRVVGRLLSRPFLLLKYCLRCPRSPISGFEATASRHPRRRLRRKVGHVQSAAARLSSSVHDHTDTANVESTLKQTLELAEAGSEIVRWTVNVPKPQPPFPKSKPPSRRRL